MTARTFALTVLLIALLAAPASAADFVVTAMHDEGNGVCSDAPDNCTLRDAVTEAGPSDVVRLPPGEYEVAEGELTLAGDSVIGTNPRTTIIDALDNSRLFYVGSGSNVISDVTMIRGDGGGEFNRVGGAVLVRNANLTVADSTIADSFGNIGGGLANFGGTLTVLRSTISNNNAGAATAGAAGGGIYSAGTTTLRNSTVSGNSANNGESPDSRGGGIFLAGGTFVARNVTIAENQSTVGGQMPTFGSALAGHPQSPTSTTLSNTIIGENGQFACANAPFQGGNNVIDDQSCTTTAVAPLLDPLENYGGPTDTHAIASNSPAREGGSGCEPGDQRGFACRRLRRRRV